MSEKEVKKVKIKVDFIEASSRENIKSGENLNTIFGKIRKIITDLHSSAFTGNAAKVNDHTVNSDVPENAKFTDTTYSNATSTTDGLMSATDKVKLDSGVATKLDSSSYKEITIATTDWLTYATSSSSAMGGSSSSSTNPDTSGYCCTVTLDTPMPYAHFNFDVKLSTDDAAAKLQIQNWNYIMADGRIEQTTDENGNTTEVTFYAFTTQPTVELVVTIQGVSE